MHRFNAEGPDGLRDRKPPRARRLNADQMRELAEIVEAGLDPEVDGVVRWRRMDLQQVIGDRFSVRYSGVGALMKALSFSFISGRPKHPKQNAEVQATFKKLPPHPRRPHRPKAKRARVEVWFKDEARIGQKNGRTRIWATKGTRPSLPADQRYANAYLFGAICPKRGVGAGLVLPRADTDAMQMHLEEISLHVTANAHGVVLMDRAGWHTTDKLRVPDNLTVVLLPSRSLELNSPYGDCKQSPTGQQVENV